MWYELRWGITGCVMLTVLLVTLIFYFHPSTTSAALFFRTVPIVPEIPGRVAEVNGRISARRSKRETYCSLSTVRSNKRPLRRPNGRSPRSMRSSVRRKST